MENKLEKPIPMELVQFECPGCEKKFYINKEDMDEYTSAESVDCPFCDVSGVIEKRIIGIEISTIENIE